MKKSTRITIIALILSTSIVYGQGTLTGVVVDSLSGKPVPFASVSIAQSTRGASADESGTFTLPFQKSDRRIKVSCIGYKSASFNIPTEKTTDQNFKLSPESVELNEIELTETRINAADILRSAIDSISRNYKTDSFNIEYYSKITAKGLTSTEEFTAESIILGYYEGYASRVRKKFELVRKRLTGENPLQKAGIELWPTFEIHSADLLADPERTGVFDKDNLDKLNWVYNGVLIYDEDTVYHISYVAPKPTKKLTGYGIVPNVYRGEIYITTTSNAVVRHDIETDKFRYSIIYKKINDWYFPYVITGHRQFNSRGLFTATNFVSLRSVIFENVKVMTYTNEREALESIHDDRDWWLQNYPADNER